MYKLQAGNRPCTSKVPKHNPKFQGLPPKNFQAKSALSVMKTHSNPVKVEKPYLITWKKKQNKGSHYQNALSNQNNS